MHNKQTRADLIVPVLPPLPVEYPSRFHMELSWYLQECDVSAKIEDLNLACFNSSPIEGRRFWHRMNQFLWHDPHYPQSPVRHLIQFLAKKVKTIGNNGASSMYLNLDYPSELIGIELLKLLVSQKSSLRIMVGGQSCGTKEQQERIQQLADGAVDLFFSAQSPSRLAKQISEVLSVNSDRDLSSGVPEGVDVADRSRKFRLDHVTDWCEDKLSGSYLPISLGSGCPHQCSFCPRGTGNISFVPRECDEIIEEITNSVKDGGTSKLWFTGLCFTSHPECEILLDQLRKVAQPISWGGSVSLLTMIDKKLVDQCHQSGCDGLICCPVHGDEEILHTHFSSETKLQNIVQNVQQLREAGIKTGVNLLVGFPSEGFVSTARNHELIEWLAPFDPLFQSVAPLAVFPLTDLYEQSEKWGITAHDPVLVHNWQDQAGSRFPVRVSRVKELVRHIRHTGRGFGNNLPVDYLHASASHRVAARIRDPLIFRDEPFHPHLDSLVRKYAYGGVSLFTGICEIEPNDEPLLQGIDTGDAALNGPEIVHLDLTNRCNMNCLACWDKSPLVKTDTDHPEPGRESLQYDQVVTLIEALVALGGTRTVKFGGGGEPTLFKGWLEVVKHLRNRDRSIEIDLNTNGSSLSHKVIDTLIETELNLLTLSLWAATPEVYQITHPNQHAGRFTEIVEQIRYLTTQRVCGLPRVFIHNVLMKQNVHELESMLELALDLGVDEVHFTLVDPVPGKTESLLLPVETQQDLLKRCKELQAHVDRWNIYREPKSGKMIKITNFNEFCAKLSQPTIDQGIYDRVALNKIPCYIGWLYTRIMANGNVVPCCKGHRMVMGNINERSFVEIWNSKRYQQFRDKGLTGDKTEPYFDLMGEHGSPIPGCANCDNIMHNTVMHDKYLFYSSIPQWLSFKYYQFRQKRR